jgi:hypothetical protein
MRTAKSMAEADMLDRVIPSRLGLARHRSVEAAVDVEWDNVTERDPCPICGSDSGCHRHAEFAFVSCSRRPSEWPLTNGGWLHRVAAIGADGGHRP